MLETDENGELEWCFPFEDSGYEVVVYDNGRVCFGYVHDYNADDDIVGDVWLYNRSQKPDDSDWSDPEKLPATLPASMVRDDIEFELPTRNSRVVVVEYTKDGEKPFYVIYVDEEILGIVRPGEKPGWARLARVPNPVARVLPDEIVQRLMD